MKTLIIYWSIQPKIVDCQKTNLYLPKLIWICGLFRQNAIHESKLIAHFVGLLAMLIHIIEIVLQRKGYNGSNQYW